MSRTVKIYDTTLRDGAQAEGISYSMSDKFFIARKLDAFGVDYIEAGNPSSNPKDYQFFEQMKVVPMVHAKLCAFGNTARPNTVAAEDKSLQQLIGAQTPAVALVGKASLLHVQKILRISPEENARLVRDSVAFIKAAGREVIFDAEHFFDGYQEDADFALSVLRAAVEGGADVLCLCDTNGGTLPPKVAEITRGVVEAFPDKEIAIHCHDDIGCAVAGTMAAVDAGASIAQGTFLGYGERCGNAALSTVIPNLMLKCGYVCQADVSELKPLAREIAEISNLRMRHGMPYVGKCAFAHKGGLHIDGVQKMASSFEHIDPALVGNERRMLLSEVGGRGSILPRLRRFAPQLTKDSPETTAIMEEVKQREFRGYQYEGAEASFELLVKRYLGLWAPHFHVIMYKLSEDFPAPDGDRQSTALIKIEVGGKTKMACATGIGPLHALDKAMRDALTVFYPEIGELRMSDYKVRVIETNKATDATTRVLMESRDADSSTFTTLGVSTDVVEASFIALVDAFEYKLSQGDEQLPCSVE